MDKYLNSLKSIFRSPELKRKLFVTAFVFFLFRLFAHIPLPGVDLVKMKQLFANNALLGLQAPERM
jgi:preprotein translocase subunit SecY